MKNSDTARFTVAGIAVLSIFVASSSSVLSQELINQKALPVDMALAIAQGAVEQCRQAFEGSPGVRRPVEGFRQHYFDSLG